MPDAMLCVDYVTHESLEFENFGDNCGICRNHILGQMKILFKKHFEISSSIFL